MTARRDPAPPPPGYARLDALVTKRPVNIVGGDRRKKPAFLHTSLLWAAIKGGLFPKPLEGPWGLAWSLDEVSRWKQLHRVDASTPLLARRERPAKPAAMSTLAKACVRCKAVKPIAEFRFDRRTRDDHRPACAACLQFFIAERRAQIRAEGQRKMQARMCGGQRSAYPLAGQTLLESTRNERAAETSAPLEARGSE